MKELYIETNATVNPLAAVEMSTQRIGNITGQTLWSNLSGKKPRIIPVGIISGGKITPAASGANDAVDVAPFTYYDENQVKRSNAGASGVAITRASNGTHRKNSIVVAAVSGTVSAIAGDDVIGVSAFSDTRGDDGGPPWIPYSTYAIEIGQVFTSASAAAPITDDEIQQNRNQSMEVYDYPVFEVNTLGDADNSTAFIKFSVDLPEIHSDDAGTTVYTKKTTALTYEPTLTFVDFAGDFVPSEKTRTGNTATTYGGQTARGEPSIATSDATFTTNPARNDTVSDYIKYQLADRGEIVTVQYLPDADEPDKFRLEQGYLSGTSANPAEGLASISFTLSPTTDGVTRLS